MNPLPPFRFQVLSQVTAISSVLTGALALLAWSLDLAVLKDALPGLALMQPNSALSFVLAGAALWRLAGRPVEGWERRLVQAGAGVVMLGGLLTLAEHLCSWDLGLDHWLSVAMPGIVSPPYPGRMTVTTALYFLLAGLALLLVDARPRPAQGLALAALVVPLLVLIYCIYNVEAANQLSYYTAVALNTTLTFIGLGVGILCVRAERGWMAMVASEGAGGTMARRLLPAAIVLPVGLGYLRLLGQQAGFYNAASGASLLMAAAVFNFSFLVWWSARALDRVDKERDRFFTVSLDLLCIIGIDGCFRRLNPAWHKVLGYSQEEILGKPYIDFVHPDDRDRTLIEAEKIAAGAPTSTFENRYRCKDGSYKWVLWNSAMPSGEQVFYATARDITARKQLEESLQEAKEMAEQASLVHRSVVDNIIDGIITIDDQGLITSFNPAAERIFGYAAAEVFNHNIRVLMPEPYHHEHDAYLTNYLQTGQKKVIGIGREVTGRRRDGSTFPLDLAVSEFVLGQRRVFTGIVRDITERKETETALRQAKEQAEHANQTKSQFLASMSHELRTPMNAIIGFSELLQGQMIGPLNEKQVRYVDNILQGGRHLLNLINDILDLSKVEAGRMELEPEPVDLGATLQDMSIIVNSLTAKKHLALNLQVEEGLPHIEADPAKLKQVLYNLLSNAIKFTPEGGQVEAGAKREGDTAVRLWVRDSGIGIKPEDHERIFEAFEQVDSSYARQQQGTGLGLALTKKLVELHQGRIWVESEGDGKGSTFLVVLPIISQKKEEVGGISGEGNGPLVLVVEDDSQARELLTTHLTAAGYRVATAVDGVQGVEQARRLQPAAIALDILLPRKDGWQVLAELKEDPQTRKIPVVIVTITEDKQRGLALGAVDFLTKPLNAEVFIQTLERVTLGRPLSSVLVIDDALPTIELLSQVLRGKGLEVFSASGGQEGISLALAHQPDCIILDLMMPQVNGFEVVQQLRARPETRQIPILVYTAKALSVEERQQLSTQVQATLSKADLDPEGMVRAIRELVEVSAKKEGWVI
ncbi:MAG: PAS domain S-box protein [Candidatus Latescibacteria bacterium]|nr:PAS domain S-box protein [Candidatus Latescibacterota bacterium]